MNARRFITNESEANVAFDTIDASLRKES